MALALTMDYASALTALDRLEGRGMKLGLERIEALLGALGEPQHDLQGVLVAGTNGKGSVCALVESMARAAGRRTVLLTKPHLLSWCERIAVDGQPIAQQRFADLIALVLAAAAEIGGELGSPTVFEVVTAAGIVAAHQAHPDLLICEVGLGGRLDSTNVLDLGVAVVTGIAVDHRDQLGDDIAAIASNSAMTWSQQPTGSPWPWSALRPSAPGRARSPRWAAPCPGAGRTADSMASESVSTILPCAWPPR